MTTGQVRSPYLSRALRGFSRGFSSRVAKVDYHLDARLRTDILLGCEASSVTSQKDVNGH